MMLTGETLQKVLDILREAGGYFCFTDAAGEEFVVSRKGDFVDSEERMSEKQLPLPPLHHTQAGQATTSLAEAVRKTARQLDTTPEFILDSINKEIASYHQEEREREIDDLSLSFDKTPPFAKASGGRQDKGKRIRFEPIHGDLPPELQE